MRQSADNPARAGELVLAFNAGSSSLKFELFSYRPEWTSRLRGAVRDIGRSASKLEWSGAVDEALGHVATHASAARHVLDRLAADSRANATTGSLLLTAHRVVHGGETYSAPAHVTDEVRERLGELESLAPLHNPLALDVIDAVWERFADVAAFAVFDTAFFADLPPHARRYAVPSSWFERFRLQRFGFHGIAHADLRDRLAGVSPDGRAPARAVLLHLGQGCSATALANGEPVETSMGFTPNEGLVMGTRSGDLDPGAVTQMARRGLDADALDRALNRESGLLGLSGESDDMRRLLELEREGHANAALAVAAFCHRVTKYVGAYAAVLGGLDALVFGGGIGENASEIRARVCERLAWLGLELDAHRNEDGLPDDRRISSDRSRVAAWVFSVHEEAAIARAALAALNPVSLQEGGVRP